MDEEYQRDQLLMGELQNGDIDDLDDADDADDYDADTHDHDYGCFDF